MVNFVVSSKVHDENVTEMLPYAKYYKHTAHKDHSYYFTLDKGEHYKLISHLSKQCPDGSTVIDIGTFLGYSALSLATNPNVSVVTYDIAETIIQKEGMVSILDVPNITYRIKNCLEEVPSLLHAPLIVLDVDPHDGVQEIDIIQALMDNNYKGVVVCDDIHLNDGMKRFWEWVPLKKVDITAFGHFTGTGAIVFDPLTHNFTVEDNKK